MNEGAEALALEEARQIPAQIRFGTSTWTYPGWKGQVYKRTYKSEKEFKQQCLEEYASLGLFRSVGIDSTFYTPARREQLERYCQQIPPEFKWISKVWERISIAHYPKHARYGTLAGQANPDFLNADLFQERVLAPFDTPSIKAHTGPFVFQFATFNPKQMSCEHFLLRLDNFLAKLPKTFQYAVEIRNPDFLSNAYFSLLNTHQVTHCFNHWHYMPPLKAQMQKAAQAGGLQANFFVARLLTPAGVSYEQAVKLFSPYDQIKRGNPEMRADAVRLVRRALERSADAYIIVNNRSEGNAPGTISAIVRMLLG